MACNHFIPLVFMVSSAKCKLTGKATRTKKCAKCKDNTDIKREVLSVGWNDKETLKSNYGEGALNE